MSYSWVKFMLAEAALTLSTEGDPRTLLEEGVRASIDKVINFAPSNLIDPDLAAKQADIDTYVEDRKSRVPSGVTVFIEFTNYSGNVGLEITISDYQGAHFGLNERPGTQA